MGGRDGERISLKSGGIAGERGGKRGARGGTEGDGNFVGLPDIAKRVDGLIYKCGKTHRVNILNGTEAHRTWNNTSKEKSKNSDVPTSRVT